MTSTLSHLIAALRRLDQEASAGLLACPFCGATPKMHRVGTNSVEIQCPCGVIIRQRCYRLSIEWLEGKMLEHWNTRANLAPNLADMLETAERALRGIAELRENMLPPWIKERAAAGLAELERLAGPGAASDAA